MSDKGEAADGGKSSPWGPKGAGAASAEPPPTGSTVAETNPSAWPTLVDAKDAPAPKVKGGAPSSADNKSSRPARRDPASGGRSKAGEGRSSNRRGEHGGGGGRGRSGRGHKGDRGPRGGGHPGGLLLGGAYYPAPDVSLAVRAQVEYYFSVENLCRDIFLRSKMDDEGWIPVAVIASFNRVRMLTPEPAVIVAALAGSPVVEISEGSDFLRVASNWASWVLPPQQRDPTTSRASVAGRSGGGAKPPAAAAPMGAAKADEDDGGMFELDEEQAGESDAPALPAEAGRKELSEKDIAKLRIVTRGKGTGGGAGHMGDDVAGLINDGLKLYEQELQTAAAKERRAGKEQAKFFPGSMPKHHKGGKGGGAFGWVMGATPPDRSGCSPSTSLGALGSLKGHGSQPRRVYGSSPRAAYGASPRAGSLLGSSAPIQKFQHPSHSLLEENGFKEMLYNKYYKRCLNDRALKGVGHSEEMNTLFRFWCYFLRENYSQQMYDDFRKYADEDAKENYMYGKECLFRFFSYGLENVFNEDLYNDFEEETLKNYKAGHLYGLEKFWAFHHYKGVPKNCKLQVHPELKEVLETKFRTLEDFRAEQKTRGIPANKQPAQHNSSNGRAHHGHGHGHHGHGHGHGHGHHGHGRSHHSNSSAAANGAAAAAAPAVPAAAASS